MASLSDKLNLISSILFSKKFINFLFYFNFSLLLILEMTLKSNHAFAQRNSNDCTQNFELSKSNLAAILRAYKCEQSASLEGCQNALNLGPNALAGLTGAAAAGSAYHLTKKMRNPNFVWCNLKHASFSEKDKTNIQYVLNKIFINSPLLSILFEESILLAESECYDKLDTFRDSLKVELVNNIEEIDKQIVKSKEKFMNSAKELGIGTDLNETQAKDSLEKHLSEQKKSYDEMISRRSKLAAEVEKQLSHQSTRVQNEFSHLRKLIQNGDIKDYEIPIKFRELSRKIDPNFNIINAKVQLNQSLINEAVEIAQSQPKILQYEAHQSALKSLNDIDILRKGKGQMLHIVDNYHNYLDNKGKLTARTFDFLLHEIYNTDAYTPHLKRRLDYYTDTILNDYVSAGQFSKLPPNFARRVNARAATRYPEVSPFNLRVSEQVRNYQNIKAQRALRALPVIGTVAGFLASIQSAVADPTNIDPGSLIPGLDSSVAGSCERDYSSIIPKNADCSINFKMNEEIFNVLSQANDEDLRSYFIQPGVCQFIQKNYSKYYPNNPSNKIKCSSDPVTLQFENKANLVISKNYIELSNPNLDGQIREDLNPSNLKPFTITERGNKTSTSDKWLPKVHPDYFRELAIFRTAAIEVAACCEWNGPDGVVPSPADCSRYGITSTPSSNIDSTVDGTH